MHVYANDVQEKHLQKQSQVKNLTVLNKYMHDRIWSSILCIDYN